MSQNIGFFYDIEQKETDEGMQKVVLYYKKEEFDTLAGLHCLDGLSNDEIEHRVNIAVKQSLDKLYKEIQTVPKEKVEGWLELYDDQKELPATCGRRIRVI